MSKEKFEQFLQNVKKEPEVDWEKLKNKWLDHLDCLYKQIAEYLKPFIESNAISLNYLPITIEEEYIGSYSARKMVIKISSDEILLDPIGTILIGVHGRVDVQGPQGMARFVLVDETFTGPRSKITITVQGHPTPVKPGGKAEDTPKETKLAWKIFTPPPSIKYVELNEDTFFELLLGVTNGLES